jgi:hypothetical protein
MINKDEYKKRLRKYLIYDVDMYDNSSICVKIFQHPVYMLFFCLDESTKMFFTLYKYMDIYVVVYDWTGNLYDNLKECDDEIITYLFKRIKIYDNLSDITIFENTYLSEEFNHFLKINY